MLFEVIAPLSDIQMFYTKYLTTYKVHMHAGAIESYCMTVRTCLYGR